MKYVIRRKSDGWFLAAGSKHTSNPANAIIFKKSELNEWLDVWGAGYEAVPLKDAQEVI